METKPYIVITDEGDKEPATDELGLDFAEEMEYNNPYTAYGEDNFDFGGSFETGGIFDDR